MKIDSIRKHTRNTNKKRKRERIDNEAIASELFCLLLDFHTYINNNRKRQKNSMRIGKLKARYHVYGQIEDICQVIWYSVQYKEHYIDVYRSRVEDTSVAIEVIDYLKSVNIDSTGNEVSAIDIDYVVALDDLNKRFPGVAT